MEISSGLECFLEACVSKHVKAVKVHVDSLAEVQMYITKNWCTTAKISQCTHTALPLVPN